MKRHACLLLAASLVALAGCGGSDGDPSTSPAEQTTDDDAPDTDTGADSGTDSDTETEIETSEDDADTADSDTVDPTTNEQQPSSPPPTALDAVGFASVERSDWSPLEATVSTPATIEESLQNYFVAVIDETRLDGRRLAVPAAELITVEPTAAPNTEGLLRILSDAATFEADMAALTAAHAAAGVDSSDPDVVAFWSGRQNVAAAFFDAAAEEASFLVGQLDAEPADAACAIAAARSTPCDAPGFDAVDTAQAALGATLVELDDASAVADSGLSSEAFCEQWVLATQITDTGLEGFDAVWIAWDDSEFDRSFLGLSECGETILGDGDPLISIDNDLELIREYLFLVAQSSLDAGIDPASDLDPATRASAQTEIAEPAVIRAAQLAGIATSPEAYALFTSVGSMGGLELTRLDAAEGLAGIDWSVVDPLECEVAATLGGIGLDDRAQIASTLSALGLTDSLAPNCSWSI